MRFKYSVIRAGQTQLDSLPRVPLFLQYADASLETVGLVDSGSTVNVLPFSAGEQLGLIWDNRKATLRLAGNLDKSFAMPVLLQVTVADFAPVPLAFAWTQHDHFSLILGQTNFFQEFEVCFFRPDFEFEIKPKQ